MTNFTPGPWVIRQSRTKVDGEYDYAIGAEIDGKVQCIAEAFGRSDYDCRPNAEANARLIAAAPDMFAALESLTSALIHNHNKDLPYWQDALSALNRAKSD